MRKTLAVAAVVLLAPALSFGSGFALYEASARGLAMGGAFTAVADDPAAMFWNAAGLAFQIDKGNQVLLGATAIIPQQTFYGQSPYPGDGYVTDQIDQTFPIPHAYVVVPLGPRTTFGFSALVPFGLGTYWDDDHAGRFISKRVDLFAFDLSPNLAFKLSDNLAFGIGVDYRISTIDLTRNLPLVDPFSQQIADVGQVHIYTDGTGNDGWGWHTGLLADVGAGFKVGATYRSRIKVDYEGIASFRQFSTGNPELDGLVASTIPFNETINGVTQIDFPDYWSVGLSWNCEKFTISGQWGEMGWSSFQELELIFPNNPEFNETIEENYENSNEYRFGMEWRASEHWAFQLGAVYDETPQPVETMTPLLGDGDRTTGTIGLSYSTKTFRLDIGYEYLDAEERCTDGTSLVGYDGCYDAKAHLAAASFTFLF
jgi:long-chain fatty acid transport protein